VGDAQFQEERFHSIVIKIKVTSLKVASSSRAGEVCMYTIVEGASHCEEGGFLPCKEEDEVWLAITLRAKL
jgi:hypothetical protein